MIDGQHDLWLDDLAPGDRVRYTPPMQSPRCPGCENGTVQSIGSTGRVVFVLFDRTKKVEPTGVHTVHKI